MESKLKLNKRWYARKDLYVGIVVASLSPASTAWLHVGFDNVIRRMVNLRVVNFGITDNNLNITKYTTNITRNYIKE